MRLTYLDADGVAIQLVEPLSADSPVAVWLAEHGEGLHHICFTADNVEEDIVRLAGAPPALVASGRGKPSAFLPGVPWHGVPIEITIRA